MLSQRIIDKLLQSPTTPEIRQYTNAIRDRLTAARPRGETPFEALASYDITIDNNIYMIKMFKEPDEWLIRLGVETPPLGTIEVMSFLRPFNEAEFRRRVKEIHEIIKDVVHPTIKQVSEVALMTDTRGTERGTIPRKGPIQIPQGLTRKIESFLTGETPKEQASRTRRGEGGKRLRRRRRTVRK